MDAEVITIGDEILIGQTIDTNSAWMAEQLHGRGVRLNRIITISDSPEEIVKAVDESFSRVDLVLMTGGLGPTQDDITKETLAEYFGTTLEINQGVLDGIESWFRSRGRDVLEVNRQQAALPKDADILKNSRGTAQGMWFEKNGKVLISMPGVPYEMKGILNDGGFEKISGFFKTQPIVHKTILTQGIGESYLAEILNDWETGLRNDGYFLAYLPSPGLVRLRISGYAENGNEKEVNARIDHYIEELNRRVPQYIYGTGKQTVAEAAGLLMQSKRLTLSTAESCTGGYIAHLITSVPGSSAHFMGSAVAYSNRAKKDVLGVAEEAISKHGAVSEEVVRQMAEGARKKFKTDYAIATSGIAGPDGGTKEKPIGLVWMAIAGPEKTVARMENPSRNRERNITISSLTALNWLRNKIISGELE
ncbi:MAG: competence/damage-inducible protein A [Cryomorphaceae bacterium]